MKILNGWTAWLSGEIDNKKAVIQKAPDPFGGYYHWKSIATIHGCEEDQKLIAPIIASAPAMLEMLKKCYSGEIEEPYNNGKLANLIVRAESGMNNEN